MGPDFNNLAPHPSTLPHTACIQLKWASGHRYSY